MSIIITPLGDSGFLKISGDINETLVVPGDAEGGPYVISLSDGTLMKGIRRDDRTHAIRVEVDGAALVRQQGGAVIVDWAVEWLTIAPANLSITPRREPSYLPLFPHVAAV
jgi:hypothetical protein